MNGSRKSDSFVVPGKSPNKGSGAPRPAEGVEGRRLTKGNPGQQNRRRTQGRESLHNALERIRQAARRDKQQRFTALWHHVHNADRLEMAYKRLNRTLKCQVRSSVVERGAWHVQTFDKSQHRADIEKKRVTRDSSVGAVRVAILCGWWTPAGEASESEG